MPELPEVETIVRGISPFLEGATIKKIKLNRADLRWPFPENFANRIKEAKVLNLKRRSKYILVHLSTGETLLIHLGMSGRILVSDTKIGNYFYESSKVSKLSGRPHIPKRPKIACSFTHPQTPRSALGVS